MAHIIEPTGKHEATVVILHGLGADGFDLAPIVPMLPATLRRHTRFVLPHAPMRPVTCNGGMVMRAWYDIIDFDRSATVDTYGIRQSVATIHALLDDENAVLPHRIALVGFSQGGVIALYAALMAKQRLAAVCGLSTYLPGIATERATIRRVDVPTLLMHGEDDMVIPLAAAQQAEATLTALGVSVQQHWYPALAHGINDDEIAVLGAFLCKHCSLTAPPSAV